MDLLHLGRPARHVVRVLRELGEHLPGEALGLQGALGVGELGGVEQSLGVERVGEGQERDEVRMLPVLDPRAVEVEVALAQSGDRQGGLHELWIAVAARAGVARRLHRDEIRMRRLDRAQQVHVVAGAAHVGVAGVVEDHVLGGRPLVRADRVRAVEVVLRQVLERHHEEVHRIEQGAEVHDDVLVALPEVVPDAGSVALREFPDVPDQPVLGELADLRQLLAEVDEVGQVAGGDQDVELGLRVVRGDDPLQVDAGVFLPAHAHRVDAPERGQAELRGRVDVDRERHRTGVGLPTVRGQLGGGRRLRRLRRGIGQCRGRQGEGGDDGHHDVREGADTHAFTS